MGGGNSRILWIDLLKFFTIILVVWGHIVNASGKAYGGIESGFCSHLYSFHMPLFMTISGYFSTKIIDGRGNIIGKFHSILVPFIIIEIILNCCGIHNRNLWYLKSLFLCYFFCYCYIETKIFLMNKSFSKSILSLYDLPIIILLCFLLFPILNHTIDFIRSCRLDFMLPFFILGMTLKKNPNLYSSSWLLILYLILFIILQYFWKYDYTWYRSPANWIAINKQIPYHFYNIFDCCMRYITGAIGSLFFISLFYNIGNIGNKYLIKFPNYGRYTLHIYILQTIFVEVGFRYFEIIFPSDNELLWVYIIPSFLAIIICITIIYIAKIIERNYYIDKYAFGNYRRQK